MGREQVEVKCKHCRKKFVRYFEPQVTCSKTCKVALRRASKVDHEVRTCQYDGCLQDFTVNRYRLKKYCRTDCAVYAGIQARRSLQCRPLPNPSSTFSSPSS